MIEILHQLDTNFFLWLNGQHAAWLDPVMVWITERNSWFPFYALLIGWLGYQFRWQAVPIVITLAVSVALSDQTASALLKPLTHRLRPCHVTALQPLIHPLIPCGGRYGFASSHASNAFTLATGLWLLLGKRYPWLGWAFLWATLLAYSRIYVGQHYPLDILAGAGIGVLMAALSVAIYRRLNTKPRKAKRKR